MSTPSIFEPLSNRTIGLSEQSVVQSTNHDVTRSFDQCMFALSDKLPLDIWIYSICDNLSIDELIVMLPINKACHSSLPSLLAVRIEKLIPGVSHSKHLGLQRYRFSDASMSHQHIVNQTTSLNMSDIMFIVNEMKHFQRKRCSFVMTEKVVSLNQALHRYGLTITDLWELPVAFFPCRRYKFDLIIRLIMKKFGSADHMRHPSQLRLTESKQRRPHVMNNAASNMCWLRCNCSICHLVWMRVKTHEVELQS